MAGLVVCVSATHLFPMARCVAVISGDGVSGSLMFYQAQEEAPTSIDGQIRGLMPGKHGLHVHVFGDFSEGFVSAGGIFNPFGRNHGAPEDEERMVGDLGNIDVDDEGIATVGIEDRQIKLIGPHSIIGRSIIVKSNQDDLGRGGNEFSLTTGNSGSRLGGGVIGIASS